jgi:hypothetical protein
MELAQRRQAAKKNRLDLISAENFGKWTTANWMNGAKKLRPAKFLILEQT